MEIIKRKIWCWIQSVEKSSKITQKVIGRKVVQSTTFFSVTFSLITFLLFFQWIQNQHPNFNFFYNIHMTLLRKNFFLLLSALFAYLPITIYNCGSFSIQCLVMGFANRQIFMRVGSFPNPMFAHKACLSHFISTSWNISLSFNCLWGLPITLYNFELGHFSTLC
jgi:hypothetical protein